MKKTFCFILLLIMMFSMFPLEYKVIKDRDNMITVMYNNDVKGYYVLATYYKLYSEVKVEIFFLNVIPLESDLTSIELEQFMHLTKYFKGIPYRPPISRRKLNQSQKKYSFTILYQGSVLY